MRGNGTRFVIYFPEGYTFDEMKQVAAAMWPIKEGWPAEMPSDVELLRSRQLPEGTAYVFDRHGILSTATIVDPF